MVTNIRILNTQIARLSIPETLFWHSGSSIDWFCLFPIKKNLQCHSTLDPAKRFETGFCTGETKNSF